MGQYIGQFSGKVMVGKEVMDLIFNNARADRDVVNLVKIGIQADPLQEVIINGQVFQIGKTGILQFNDVNITSIIFNKHPYKNLIDNTQHNYYTYAIIDYLYTDPQQTIEHNDSEDDSDSVMLHNDII